MRCFSVCSASILSVCVTKSFSIYLARNGTVRRHRFGDEMRNVFSFGMPPKCKSSHCRCEACRRKIQSSTCPNRTAMRAVYPNVHTHNIDADNQLHNCVCGARCLSRWRCYKYTCKITAEKNGWIAIALLPLHRNVKVNYSKSIYDFLRSKQLWRYRQLLKRLFSKYDAWLIFCSDNAATIFEASCRAFQYEKFLIKNIVSVETNPRFLGVTLRKA